MQLRTFLQDKIMDIIELYVNDVRMNVPHYCLLSRLTNA